ncbi:MAG: HEAT repeat domain-containing protein [Chloroflexia bacterium]
MTAGRKPDFARLLAEILGEGHPLSYSRLRCLSNPQAEHLATFREAWPRASRERRRQVVRALAQLSEDNPDLNFRDVLFFCLADPDEGVRSAAIEGLTDDEGFSLLERLLLMAAEDPSPTVRSEAILALGRFVYMMETTDLLEEYRHRLLRLLLGIFDDPQTPLEVRRRAVETVSYIGDSAEVEEVILRAYNTAEREMRVSAIHAMGHHMAERWQPFLERELASPDPEMRYEAAWACGEIGDPRWVPHLAPLLDDADHEVVRAAIWALGEIGGVQARRLLERCLEREEEDIREAAEEALHTLRFFADPMELF